MSDSTEQQTESKTAVQLRQQLVDVALIRHQVENLWRRYETVMPEWTSPRSKAWDPSSSDLAAWVAGVNKLNNAFDALLDTEAVISAGILDLEAGVPTTDADDEEAADGVPDRSEPATSSAAEKGQTQKPPTFRFDYEVSSPWHDWNASPAPWITERFLQWAHDTGADVGYAIDVALFAVTQWSSRQRQQELDGMRAFLNDETTTVSEQTVQGHGERQNFRLDIEANSPWESFGSNVRPAIAEAFLQWAHDEGLSLRRVINLAVFSIMQTDSDYREQLTCNMTSFLESGNLSSATH